MKFLMEDLRIQRCVFLSGDVHFCSTISATFTKVPKSQGQGIRTIHIVQLTSSAFKNITPINNAIDALYNRRLRKIINWYSAHSPSIFPKRTYRLSDLIHTNKDGFATLHFDEMSQPFVETRTYEYPENSPNMFLFNATNIGYVRISPDAQAIEHELCFIDDPRSLSYSRMTRVFSDSNFYKRVVSLRLPLMQYGDLISIIEAMTATRVLE
jgi:hypothetical protein